MIISELGVTPDWSAAYTPNSGPMDSILKIQLDEHRHHSAQEYVHILRRGVCQRQHALRDWNSRSTRAA